MIGQAPDRVVSTQEVRELQWVVAHREMRSGLSMGGDIVPLGPATSSISLRHAGALPPEWLNDECKVLNVFAANNAHVALGGFQHNRDIVAIVYTPDHDSSPPLAVLFGSLVFVRNALQGILRD